MTTTRRFEPFFYAYEERFKPLEVVRTPDTPTEMEVREVSDSPGWVQWRFYPWSSSVDIFRPYEESTGLRFPELFKDFLTTFHTLRLDLGFIRFPGTPLRREGRDLGRLVAGTPQDVLGTQILPFGWYGGRGDSGVYGFKLTGCTSVEDAEIACVRYHARRDKGVTVAASFETFVAALEFQLRCDVDFLGRGRTDPDADRSFEEFLGHDQAMLVGGGRSFWESLR